MSETKKDVWDLKVKKVVMETVVFEDEVTYEEAKQIREAEEQEDILGEDELYLLDFVDE